MILKRLGVASQALGRGLPEGERRLFYGGRGSVVRALVGRMLFVFALVSIVVVIFWVDRTGLRDNFDGEVSFTDVLYFTAVTITTVGYGDIVPVDDYTRLVDAAVVTPIRLLIWLIFLGTAYQLVFQRIIEDFRMRIRQGEMQNHVVICGYGHSGRSAAQELMRRGTAAADIVIVDESVEALEQAAEDGHVGIRGDTTREQTLREARLDTAQAAIVSAGRDDTTVLTVLTLKHLAPQLRILAIVHEAENDILVKQSGASATLLPSRIGGILLANALDSIAATEAAQDLITADGDMRLRQRLANAAEIGKPAGRQGVDLVVKIIRNGRSIGYWEADATIAAGDTLVVIEPTAA